MIGTCGALAFFGCGGSATVTHADPQHEPERSQANARWPTALLAGTEAERVVVPTEGAPAKGADAPLVTIVEFSDFQCPFCSRANPTLSQLLENYPKDVRIVFRHNPLPFHKQAVPAAVVSLEAQTQRGDEGFWQAHDMLFANQDKLGSLEETAALIESVRRALSLQPTGEEQIDDLLGRIEHDMDLAERVGARGTPIFFINGRMLSGARPYEDFEEIVDEEIALAKVALNNGADRRNLYALAMEAAREAPASEPDLEPDLDPEPTFDTPPRPGRPDPKLTYYVPIGKAPVLGPDDALVTIVTYSDFECPFCSRALPTLEQVREKYGKDVRLVFKNNPLPFHQDAKPAAVAALEAQRQGKDAAFWKMHDKLFAQQQQLNEDTLAAVMKELKLNPKPLSSPGVRKRHEKRIEEEQAEARRLGALGTPSFFINGRFLSGAQPFAVFAELIDEERVKAAKMVSDGVPRKKLYAAIIEKGVKEVEQPDTGPAPPVEHFEIAVPSDAPTKGPKNAPITIQIFSDFECPFCSRAVPTLKQLEKEYRGKLRFVWYHYPLPFHQNAQLAHEASIEVMKQKGSRAFWRFHDVLFENQRALAPDQLVAYAKKLGVQPAKLSAALETRTHQARVQADMGRVSAAEMRIGTPTFLINGGKLSGAQPIELFRERIDAELEKLKKK